MATYLLAWNPKRWPWDDLADAVREVRERGFAVHRWGCGNSTHIRPGDRVFLIRLGQEPKGIVGSGVVVGEPYEVVLPGMDGHAGGRRVRRRVDVRFDRLLDPERDPIIPRELLRHQAPFSAMHWDTQMSGVRIPDAIAAALERLWAKTAGTG